jgi:hypothetical protein
VAVDLHYRFSLLPANISPVRADSIVRASAFIFCFPMALLFLCPIAAGQLSQGWIEGEVRDTKTSRGIARVRISIASGNAREFASALTDNSGAFHVIGVPPGDYELSFTQTGYVTAIVAPVRVQSSSGSSVEVEMHGSQAAGQGPVHLSWKQEPVNPWGTDAGSVFDLQRLSGLPSARNIWALLQNQEPSSVTNRVDEGGMETGIIALVGSNGGSWTQNGYRLDGINATDPYDTGKPLVYPQISGLVEFQVATAFHSAATAAPGASFNLTIRRGTGRTHAQAEAYYLGLPFQSSNLDGRLRSLGYSTDPHFKRLAEGVFSAGGPIPRISKWSFFSSFEAQHLSKMIPDFSRVATASVASGLLRFDGEISSRNKLALMATGQIVNNSNLGAQSQVAPESTLHGHDRFEVVRAHWTRSHGMESIWDLSFGFSHSSPTDTLQAGITQPNRTQLLTGEMTGAAPLETDSALSRFSLLGQGQAWRNLLSRRMNNRLYFGFDLEESLATEERRVFRDIRLLFYPRGVPSEIIEYNSPSHAMQRLREFSLFVEDQVEISRRLFLRFGLNLDASSAWLPPQRSGPGIYAPARAFSGARGIASWTTVSPRSSLSFPVLTRAGVTRLIAGFSRYFHLLPARYADFANPTSLGGQAFRWEDNNRDGVFQPGEEGTLLRVFGGPYSSVDSQLKRPFTDEWGIGLTQSLGRQLVFGLRLMRRDSRRLVQTVNTGVPPSAFVSVKIPDPGDDGAPGTSDDQILTLYNQDPRSFGQDHFLLTNPKGFNAAYRGIEAEMNSGLFGRGSLAVSFTAFKSVGNGNPGNTEFENDPGVVGALFDNPNTKLNSLGRLFFDRAYVGKIAAYYRMPLGFHAGSLVRYLDGLPFGRRVIIAGFNQGPFFVMATPRGQPGGFRTQFNLTFDQRIGHDFTLGRLKLSALIDIFNLLNLNKNLREADLTGPLFPSRAPLQFQNPRVMRFGLKVNL